MRAYLPLAKLTQAFTPNPKHFSTASEAFSELPRPQDELAKHFSQPLSFHSQPSERPSELLRSHKKKTLRTRFELL